MTNKVYAIGNVIYTAVNNNVVCICVNGVMTNELVKVFNAHDALVDSLTRAIPFIGYQASVEEIKDSCHSALEKAGSPYGESK